MADYQSFDALDIIIDCELCKSRNIDTVALKFCADCSKQLCSDCVSLHNSTKATKDHSIIDKKDIHNVVEIRANTIMSGNKTCEPCAGSGKDSDALTYCEECEELLCADCTSSHKVSKATRKHTPIGIDDMKSEDCKECEPCQYKGLGIKAFKFCSDCEELLCETCSKSHEFQKATKHHTQIGIEDISKKGRRKCDLCISLNKHEIAASFCNDCEEAFCKICATTHISQKATKSHSLIDIGNIREVTQLCEPCQQSGKSISAFKYCLECEELLCENCTKVHQTQKATKLHQLLEATKKSIFSGDKVCDNCKLANKSVSAGTYCNDCEEYYCNLCTTAHQSMKATRNHTLSDAKDIELNEINNCDQCLIDKLNKKAKYFCNNCAEFYCEKCHSSHKRVKASRHHITVSENEARNRLNTNCDPCNLFNSSNVRACHYCEECIEFLCQTCSQEHKEQKTTRDHQLITATERIKEKSSEPQTLCEPCNEVATNKPATSFCQDCREPMCENCSRKHVRQKPTRDHKISNNLNLLREILIANPEQQEAPDLKSLSDEVKNISLNKNDENGASAQPKEENESPGKPIASDIKADSIRLTWDKPEKFLPTDYYQIRFKDLDGNRKWKFMQKYHDVATAMLTDLKANTRFMFQVRVVHEDGERPYGPESDVVTTSSSPATRIVEFAPVTRKGNPLPNVHALPITENRHGRNVAAKTKKFEICAPPYALRQEKTIMLVGATGTGKSTLVDGMVNYILGVKWDDPFRFSIIDLEQEEKDRHQNQALSQTEWITCYSINPEQGSRLGYRLNIIDTPGFGDTRGLKRDQEIVDQIRNLFSETGQKGIANIDAVCFLVKAPDARLTAVQTYIFQSIMALFGQNIEHNITTLVTFADGVEPPVLAALDQSGLPFGKPFTFNNSGLFTKNVDLGPNSLSPMFWEMGGSSFRAFFIHLDKMETKSLQQSKQVLEERLRLETTIQNLQPQVDAGLSKLNELKTELKIFNQHKADIAANKDFEYEVKETQQKKSELPQGQHVTNCLNCNVTCHQRCIYANDSDKQKCSAMDGKGNCRQCSDKCNWKQHANTPYIFEYTEVTKKKTYAEKLAKYNKLTGQQVTAEKIIETMANELVELEEGIEELMQTVKDCNDRLKEIALRPHPLNMVEHIDMMIEAEKLEKKEGYQPRIAMLNEFRQKAEISLRVKDFSSQANAARKTVQSSTNRTIPERQPKPKGFINKFISRFNPF